MALDTASLDRIVAEWLESTGAPSVSIAIVQDDALVYAKAYGNARLSPEVAATPASRYAIDSVSKEFTAAAALILVQQGKLSLDDTVSKYLPELTTAAQVTVRELLTHTSGLRDFWPQDFVPPEMSKATTTAQILANWGTRPLDFEPGSDWQYSNTGYAVAGAIIEKISGKPLFGFLQHEIFAPLRMTQVADYTASVAHPHRPDPADALPYTRYGLAAVTAAPVEGAGWLFAAAGLAMQPRELALWDVSLMKRSLLSASSYETEFAPIVLKSGKATNYALGLDVETVQGRLRIGHAGGGSGFLADNRVWPAQHAAIVVLTNNDWASPGDLGDRLASVVLPPNPVEARARALFLAMQSGTVERSAFSEIGNAYLTAKVLADLKASLAPLGAPSLFELEHEGQRGGMTTRRWKVLCRGTRLEIVERSRPDGKVEQFLVAQRQD